MSQLRTLSRDSFGVQLLPTFIAEFAYASKFRSREKEGVAAREAVWAMVHAYSAIFGLRRIGEEAERDLVRDVDELLIQKELKLKDFTMHCILRGSVAAPEGIDAQVWADRVSGRSFGELLLAHKCFEDIERSPDNFRNPSFQILEALFGPSRDDWPQIQEAARWLGKATTTDAYLPYLQEGCAMLPPAKLALDHRAQAAAGVPISDLVDLYRKHTGGSGGGSGSGSVNPDVALYAYNLLKTFDMMHCRVFSTQLMHHFQNIRSDILHALDRRTVGELAAAHAVMSSIEIAEETKRVRVMAMLGISPATGSLDLSVLKAAIAELLHPKNKLALVESLDPGCRSLLTEANVLDERATRAVLSAVRRGRSGSRARNVAAYGSIPSGFVQSHASHCRLGLPRDPGLRRKALDALQITELQWNESRLEGATLGSVAQNKSYAARIVDMTPLDQLVRIGVVSPDCIIRIPAPARSRSSSTRSSTSSQNGHIGVHLGPALATYKREAQMLERGLQIDPVAEMLATRFGIGPRAKMTSSTRRINAMKRKSARLMVADVFDVDISTCKPTLAFGVTPSRDRFQGLILDVETSGAPNPFHYTDVVRRQYAGDEEGGRRGMPRFDKDTQVSSFHDVVGGFRAFIDRDHPICDMVPVNLDGCLEAQLHLNRFFETVVRRPIGPTGPSLDMTEYSLADVQLMSLFCPDAPRRPSRIFFVFFCDLSTSSRVVRDGLLRPVPISMF